MVRKTGQSSLREGGGLYGGSYNNPEWLYGIRDKLQAQWLTKNGVVVDKEIKQWLTLGIKRGNIKYTLEIYMENTLPAKTVPRNRLIMLRYLEGQHVDEIAEHFDLQPSTISGILNSPLVRQEMEAMSQNATERVANLTDEALDLVRDTMRGKSNSELKYKAATNLLDRNKELNPKHSDARELAEGLGEGMIRAIGKQIREIEKGKEAYEIPSSDIAREDVDSGSDNSSVGE